MPKNLITIGDLHGDLDATVRILQGLSLIDNQGDWIGKDTHLVQIGDLIDRGRDSVNLMDYLMELQKQAETDDSRVDCLIGNHELMVAHQDFRYIRPAEMLQYERFCYNGVDGLDALFRGDSPYAAWLRERPAMMNVDGILFVHAGVDEWALDYSIDQLNQITSTWLGYLQGVVDDPPDQDTESILNGETGMLWHEGFRIDVSISNGWEPVRFDLLEKILVHFDAQMLIVGHRPTFENNHRISWPHPFYGDKVAVIDTGICDYYDGRLSASTIENGKLIPQYFDRGNNELELTKRIRQGCAERRKTWPG